MKNRTTNIVIALTLIVMNSINAFSQTCNRKVDSFIKLPSGYDIKGTATLELLSDKSFKISFSSDFNTSAGPDLFIYLTQNNDAPTAAGNNYIEVAQLTSNMGAQSYTFTNLQDITSFNYIVIHCKQYNHVWGGGMLGSRSAECNATSLFSTSIETDNVLVFPNPTLGADVLNVQNIDPSSIINLLDVYGNVKLSNVSLTESKLSIASLENGVYFLEIRNNTKSVKKKIIVSNPY